MPTAEPAPSMAVIFVSIPHAWHPSAFPLSRGALFSGAAVDLVIVPLLLLRVGGVLYQVTLSGSEQSVREEGVLQCSAPTGCADTKQLCRTTAVDFQVP